MNRRQLEHIIRASAATVDLNDIVVIGSQSILGTYATPPASLVESDEADVFPRDTPERSIIIDGSIGEMSLFHSTFGYYAHGVDETTATLPDGWRDRLIKLQSPATMGAIGWCLEVHDLAVSKLVAGREKDLSFVHTLVTADLAKPELIEDRLEQTSSLSPELRNLARKRLLRESQ